jgi:23S rRNA pseudouridine2605 synthase
MCRDLELTITQLKRVQQGSLKLDGLESGHFRELTNKELAALRKSVGL